MTFTKRFALIGLALATIAPGAVSADNDQQIYKATVPSSLDIEAPSAEVELPLDDTGTETVFPVQTWTVTGNPANGLKVTFSAPRFLNGTQRADCKLALANPAGLTTFTIPAASSTSTLTTDATLEATATGPVNAAGIELAVTMINPVAAVAGTYLTTVTGTVAANP